jgi:hypothetical protein
MMKSGKTNRRTFLMSLLGAGVGGALLRVRGSAQTAGLPLKEGFIPLFNGKDLDGWHAMSPKAGKGSGGLWQVSEGVLTGEQDPPGSGNGGYLMTDLEFGDFELLLELAPDYGIDSGVFLRTNSRGEGFQVYVDYREQGNVGWLSSNASNNGRRMIIRPFNIFAKRDENGALTGFATRPDSRPVAWKPDYLVYSASEEEWLDIWKLDQWNTMRIRCVGAYPRITIWTNQIKILEFDGASCPQPDYDKEVALERLGKKGAIALQVHEGQGLWTPGAKCRWRNIRIKPLG